MSNDQKTGKIEFGPALGEGWYVGNFREWDLLEAAAWSRRAKTLEQALIDLMAAIGEEPYESPDLMKAMKQAKEILRPAGRG